LKNRRCRQCQLSLGTLAARLDFTLVRQRAGKLITYQARAARCSLSRTWSNGRFVRTSPDFGSRMWICATTCSPSLSTQHRLNRGRWMGLHALHCEAARRTEIAFGGLEHVEAFHDQPAHRHDDVSDECLRLHHAAELLQVGERESRFGMTGRSSEQDVEQRPAVLRPLVVPPPKR
jgi:hypothetical protein